MTRRSSRLSRPTTTAPQGGPDPTMPSDVETLPAQLRLSRKQCAYLHRELATALKQGLLALSSVDGAMDAVRAKHVNLRERLTFLTRHLEQTSNRQQQEFDALLRSVCGEKHGAFQSTLVNEPMALTQILQRLLALAHPDKWSQEQPATVLAQEIPVAVNGLREQLGVQV